MSRSQERPKALRTAQEYLDASAVESTPTNIFVPELARESMRQNSTLITGVPVQIHWVDDQEVPGSGPPITIRIYRPREGLLPALIYMHGGGFVVGDLDTIDGVCRRLSVASDCVVVSVDYRRAPESPFPAALEDAWSVVSWLCAGSLPNVDSSRIAVAGDSAGGNLAAVVATRAARLNLSICYQVLIYPWVDLRDDPRASRADFADGYGLDGVLLDWYRHCYLPDNQYRSRAEVSPLLADVAGSPPALVITAECDALRDQGEEYILHLESASVPVTGIRYVGELHGFIRADRTSLAANSCVRVIASTLRSAWDG